ncbi:alpha/beta fold hydrolase [uncultured Roseobacter sp.]|uniref:alpha/beta fold hydrolase n=1 Tax=uncultured Roseobacter sp. TaxID=114847 RepID=UPI00344B5D48
MGSVFKGKVTLIAPDFLGTRIRGHVDASKAFRLKHEAAHVIELIEEVAEPGHVVGHSYGGAVALHVACAVPQLVQSLCLYEPTLFSHLSAGTAADRTLHAEIVRLAASLQASIEEDFARSAPKSSRISGADTAPGLP